MQRHRTSLRTSLIALTAIATMLGFFGAASLLAVSTALQHSSSVLADAVESVRLAEEAEIELLFHDRATDRLVRRQHETELMRRLVDARQYASSGEETELLEQAERAVKEYFVLAHDPNALREVREAASLIAFSALEQLIEINVSEADRVRARADRWRRAGQTLGLGSAGLLVLLAAGLIWWLKGRALRPVFDLAQAIERFARGDRSVRAPETGPAELTEMARQFNAMADALAEQRATQMHFLGGVAHDLKNPLSALKLWVDVVAPGRPAPSEEKMRRALEMVGRQVQRLERMVGDFLEITKIEAGQLELKLAEHDARAIVRGVVELFEASSPKHVFVVKVPDEPLVMRCDGLRVEQVLGNLVSNAIKYSPGGKIEVALTRATDAAVFSVSDEGMGIAEEDQKRLFEPFRRVGLSRESIAGVGLGLFVVRQLVLAHAGDIAVSSKPGRGTTFRVTLPLQPPPNALKTGSAQLSVH